MLLPSRPPRRPKSETALRICLPQPPSQRPRPRRSPSRFTLDLDRAHHQFLKEYAAEIEAKGASEVMRALLDELRDDPELAGRVRARVWGTNR